MSELSPPEDVARCIMMCARIPPGQPPARLGWSWISLTSSLALRVLDEAANDFLQVYNAAVRAIRARLSFLPLPAFTFRVWLTGLTAAVLILACLTPLAFHGKAGLRYIACPNAVLMLGSGLASHASTAGGSPMPGV